MKDSIEAGTSSKSGKLEVYRFGTCSGSIWEIFFKTLGGDVKPFEVTSTSISGASPSVTVETIQDGGILYGPLSAEFLRVPKESPQVKEYILFFTMFIGIPLINWRGLVY